MHSALQPHNHNHCIDDALTQARSLCSQRQVRLTPQREQVLRLVWASHKPVGAYQVMDSLSQQSGKTVAPPTVYRALDFLLEQRLIHRINSLNAFVGCHSPGHNHPGQFLICRQCGVAQELDSQRLSQPARQLAEASGFTVEALALELTGLCPLCQELA